MTFRLHYLAQSFTWFRMLSIQKVGAWSAYPSFMKPLFRQSPSVSVRLDVFLLAPTIPDLFSLG